MGESTGLEAWGKLQVTPRWRLSAGGTLLDQDLRLEPGSGDTRGVSAAGNDPKRQFSLRSSHELGAGRELDLLVRYVSALPDPAIPATRLVSLCTSACRGSCR
jgi:iron complex outermembrane receptor protein